MLSDLHVRDFVIAEDLLLEFDQGLSVLTGETGAGKSILIGALGLVLGARADSQSVRKGADKTQISAVFDLSDHTQASDWLQAHDLDSDGECVIRRVVQTNGRSKAFINGKPVPVQQLKDLGRMLVEIHGQHEHQAMLKPVVQRQLLDNHGTHHKQLDKVATSFALWKSLDTQLEELRSQLGQKSSRIDLLRFQSDELLKLEIQDGEYDSLAEEQYKLSHVATLAEASLEAIDNLSAEGTGTQSTINQARRAVENLTSIDNSLGDISTLLESAEIQIGEAVSELQRYHQDLDMDPQRRDLVETRLDSISGLAKKHQIDAAGLGQLLSNLQKELHQLEHAEDSIAELESELKDAGKCYLAEAAKLSRARTKSAKSLAKNITELVQQLGMPTCVFDCQVQQDKKNAWREDGIDQVEFTIQANLGEPVRPVSKVASGGELSRLSLAVHVVSASADGSACMVFDEVDAGVGGAVADMIGRQLQQLGQTRQVFSVTHLPQVACHGHHHFKVSKSSLENRTRSQVIRLNEKDCIEELARMLGGAEVTATTKRHAKELRNQAKNIKQSA